MIAAHSAGKRSVLTSPMSGYSPARLGQLHRSPGFQKALASHELNTGLTKRQLSRRHLRSNLHNPFSPRRKEALTLRLPLVSTLLMLIGAAIAIVGIALAG
ncbi:hypothetical protein M446_1255 [Methylobacterium sp. 4-46]|nr:hypothetical protein M446_1255 [Methylobacterium sp. 4-46]